MRSVIVMEIDPLRENLEDNKLFMTTTEKLHRVNCLKISRKQPKDTTTLQMEEEPTHNPNHSQTVSSLKLDDDIFKELHTVHQLTEKVNDQPLFRVPMKHP